MLKMATLLAVAGLIACNAASAQAYEVIKDKTAFAEGTIYVGEILYYVEYGADQVTAWDGKENNTFLLPALTATRWCAST